MEMSDNEVHESENKERIVMGSKGKKDVRKKRVVEVVDSRYQPTKVELEADLSLAEGVTPEEVVRAMFSGDPPRVESGKGKPSTEK